MIVVTLPVVDNVTPVPAAKLGRMFPVSVVHEMFTHEMLLMFADEAFEVLEFSVVMVMLTLEIFEMFADEEFTAEALMVVTDSTDPVLFVNDTFTLEMFEMFAFEVLTSLDVNVLMFASEASKSTSDRTESSLICNEGVPEILNAPVMSEPST